MLTEQIGESHREQDLQAEVDVTLMDWCLELSIAERLRVAAKAAAALERLARAASSDG